MKTKKLLFILIIIGITVSCTDTNTIKKDIKMYGQVWHEIQNKKMGVRFSRQIPIDQHIVDFYCKDLQLAIEVDGAIHFEEGPKKTLIVKNAWNSWECTSSVLMIWT